MATLPVNFVIFISVFIFLIYLIGLHSFLTRTEENACEMTYMFEYPRFVEISLPPDIQRKYPRYSLYGYSEGSTTKDLRQMNFLGIPVIFIPGTSGSHRQARSLASVALRKAISSRSSFHFNFFSINFSEDLSGIYGGVLTAETEFVRISIEKVLSLYKKDGPYVPDSVVLIGHSAGGIVAKNVFTRPDFDHRLVKLIITLATPHLSPVIHADPFLTNTYDRVSKMWHPRSANVSHVTLVSIGGGNRDVVVRSDLTKDYTADINVLTTAVPGVWISMDHLSITWCKQLMLTIARALFDSVDPRVKQISDVAEDRVAVFKYHLQKRSAGKKLIPFSTRSSFERSVKWIENLQRQFTVIEKKGLKSPQFVMLRLFDDVKHAAATVEAVNLNVKDWVFVCVADSFENDFRVCVDGINLSNETEIIPARKSRRKVVRLDMLDLKRKGFSHALIRFPPISAFMSLNVDVYNPADRAIAHSVPRMSSLTSDVIIESTTNNAVHYTVNLLGFDQVWQAFELSLEALTCKTSNSHAVVTFSPPWANESQSFHLVDEQHLSATLKLFSPRPPRYSKTSSASLTFILDPSCKYRISLRPNYIAVAAQLARYYSHLMPGYIVAVLLLTLKRQIESVDEGSGVPIFHNALAQGVRKYYLILQTTIIGSRVFGMKLLTPVFPLPDPLMLQELGLDFFLLPVFLFLLGTAVTYIAGAVIYGAVIISGQAAHKLAFRFLARTVTGVASLSEWAVSALHQLPFLAATLLVSLSWSTVGGLGMALAASFYFLTLCKLYEDYLEELFKMSLKFAARTIKNVFASGKGSVSPSASPTSEIEGVMQEQGNIKDEKGDEDEEKVDLKCEINDSGVKSNDDSICVSNNDSTEENKEPAVENDADLETDKKATIEKDEGSEYGSEDDADVSNSEQNEMGSLKERLIKSDVGCLEIFKLGEEKKQIEDATGPVHVAESVDSAPERRVLSTLEEIHFHVTLCLLYVLAAATAVPSVLAWSRSFHQSTQLHPDPAWIPGLILPTAGCLFWQGGIPLPNRRLSIATTSILFALAACCIMFGSVSLYRLPYFIAMSVVYLVVHQTHARWVSS